MTPNLSFVFDRLESIGTYEGVLVRIQVLVGCLREDFSKEVQGVPRSANAANTNVRATRSARTFACRVATLGDAAGSKDSVATAH
jgi:hypothetical protein